MFDIVKFFQPAYLFEYRPFTTNSTIKIMAIFFIAFIIFGIALKIYQRTKKLEKYQEKLLEKFISFFSVLGFLGLIITWTRYERVLLFSSRYWLIVWLITLLIWLYPIIKYWVKVVPEARKHTEEKKLFQKYLPKKN